MVKKFSTEVATQIGFYVYRLIDPRNGQTFYVGKGKENRVLFCITNAHAAWLLLCTQEFVAADFITCNKSDKWCRYTT